MRHRLISRLLAASALSALLGACVENGASLPANSRHWVALSTETQATLTEKEMTKSAPILLRAYKKESEIEVWKQTKDGSYALLKTFPMCRWSGQLGPKVREGDRQVPEGFYAITPGQLNPNSNYYLSFNVGYPNQLDRAEGHSGGLIMVHGDCSSAGCFSMTDEQIADLYALAREAFAGGQKSIQMQSLPFRMTAKNLAKYRLDANMPFWKNLKDGADHFEVTKREPQVAVCGRRYVFNQKSGSFDATSACPPSSADASVVAAVRTKQHTDDVAVAELVREGEKAVRPVYRDGDQHPVFKEKAVAQSGQAIYTNGRLAYMSRPDALAEGLVEIPVDEGKSAKGSIAGKAAPASLPAKAPTVVASLSGPTGSLPEGQPAPEPQAQPVKTASLPFYSRWVGGEEAKDDAEATAAATPAIVNVPLPPVRAGVASLVVANRLPGGKPMLSSKLSAYAPAQ